MKLILAVKQLVDDSYAIGYKNELLVHSKIDMEHFVEYTGTNPIVMGHDTFKSLNSKPLRRRVNYVLTRDTTLVSDNSNLVYINDLKDAPNESVVIGGATVYALAVKDPRLTEISITNFLYTNKMLDLALLKADAVIDHDTMTTISKKFTLKSIENHTDENWSSPQLSEDLTEDAKLRFEILILIKKTP